MSSPMNPEEDKSDEAQELSMDSISILNSEPNVAINITKSWPILGPCGDLTTAAEEDKQV
ncbi:MAG: hypothetical protein QXH93_05495 [Conexivisphaerales archaeon]